MAMLRLAFVACLMPFLLAAPLGDRQKARAHYEKGLEQFREGDVEKAAKEFRRAAQEDPTWADAHYQLGQAYLSLGEWDEAETSNSKAVELDPNHPDAAWWKQLLADRRALAKTAELAQRHEFSAAGGRLLTFLDTGGDLNRAYDAFSVMGIHVGWMDGVVQATFARLADTAQWNRLQIAALNWMGRLPQRKNLIRHFVFKLYLDRDLRWLARHWVQAWERESPEDPLGVLSSWGALLLREGDEAGAAATYQRFEQTLKDQPGVICYRIDEEFVAHFGGSYQSFLLLDRTLGNIGRASYEAGIGGTLQLTGVIETDGTVSGARVEGQGLGYGLDEAAVNDIARWRFAPGRINGAPVRLFALIEVTTP